MYETFGTTRTQHKVGNQLCAKLKDCMRQSSTERISCVSKATAFLHKHLGDDISFRSIMARLDVLEEELLG